MRFNDLAAGLVLAGCLIAPLPARAINPDAQSLFAQGRRLRAEGKCEEAIPSFRKAFELSPEGLGALRNIAECEEALGRFASARVAWLSLRRAVLQTSDTKYLGWDKDAEAAYQKLEGKVGRITIEVEAKDLSRVTVTIDDKPLDPRLFGVEIERDLGERTIQAVYGGAAPIVERRALVASKKERVILKIPEAPPPANVPDKRPLRVGGYVSLAVGGAGVIGLISSIAIRQSAAAIVQDQCSKVGEAYSCPPAYASDVERGRTTSLLVNVFTGVAIAGVGVGAALLVVGRDQAPKQVSISPSLQGILIQGSF